MARIAGSGDLSLNAVKNALGVSPTANIGSIRRGTGTGVGYTPETNNISLGHAYGAFNLGPAKIISYSTYGPGPAYIPYTPVNLDPALPGATAWSDYIAATSPVPAGLTGVTNPGNGYYASYVNGGGGEPGINGMFFMAGGSSSENIRFYSRIMNWQVPWAQFFEGTGALGYNMGSSTSWSGSLSYISAIWMSTQNGGTYQFYNNLDFATLTSNSEYTGAVWSDGSTLYFGQLNSAQMMAGTFSATWAGAMFGIGSFARNSQCNHYYRFGGSGITSYTHVSRGIGVRGYAYNHDYTGIGPGSKTSGNNAGFLKYTPGVSFPATHNGPGGGTTFG